MIFMALDHSRDFLTNIRFEPEDIDRTFLALFLSRWITHFCAPAFFLLTGAGAYVYASRHSTGELRRFLLLRGIWLVALEFTIVGFAWTFHLGWGMFGVICCLGISMVGLALFTYAPRWLIAGTAILLIAGHDAFDKLQPSMFHSGLWLLLVLHRSGEASIGSWNCFVLFPIIPWFGVALLGYAMGNLLLEHNSESRSVMFSVGVGSILLFMLLRSTNIYGNPNATLAHSTPGEWHYEPTAVKSVMLFLDVEKYPPSLQYLLMTLGPILMCLAISSKWLSSCWGRVVAAYGRVPLFFYVLHLYIIHSLAIIMGMINLQPVGWLIHGGFFLNEVPEGYGYSLPIVCLVWVAVVLLLYVPCVWFGRLKQRYPDSLLSYL